MAPPSKRRKVDSPSKSSNGPGKSGNTTADEHPFHLAVTDSDKRNWQGFCELESEPAYFNTMLRDWGVQGVKVEQVWSLDPDSLLNLAKPTYGLVFLFQYKADDLNKQEASCPAHVWFANQTNDNACATVSLLNIVLNLADFQDVELGPHLESFREFTEDFTPALRGDEIGHFEFVKQVHNSFARKMDIYNTDLGLMNKYDDRNKPKAKPKPKPKPKSKSELKKGKKGKKGAVISDSDYEEDPADGDEDDNAYHFQAYVPIGADIWMLDGLNRQPVKVGPVPEENSTPLGWLGHVAPVLQERMEMYQANDINVSLLSLGKDSSTNYLKDLASNVNGIEAVERRLDELKPTWRDEVPGHQMMTLINGAETTLAVNGNGPSTSVPESRQDHMEIDPVVDNATHRVPPALLSFGLTPAHLERAPLPSSISTTVKTHQTTPDELMHARTRLHSAQQDVIGLITAERENQREDERNARNRRADYGALVRRWLEMLCAKEGEDGKEGTILREMCAELR